MAVLAVVELFDDRSGTPFSIDADRDYTRKFRVQVDSVETSPFQICNDPRLPLNGSFYVSGGLTEYDTQALLIKKSCAPQDKGDWQFWIVTCDYSTKLPNGGGTYNNQSQQQGQNQQNEPDREQPEVDYDWEMRNIAFGADALGKPYNNSAGVPFKPSPTTEVGFALLTMSRNELYYDLDVATQYNMTSNLDVFLGRPKDTVLCLPIKAKMMFRGPLQYWRVTYKFRFTPPDPENFLTPMTWKRLGRILDEGTHERIVDPKDPTNKKLVPIYEGGTPVSTPRLLNGAGRLKQLQDADGNLTPTWLQFTTYTSSPFTELIQRGPIGADTYALLQKLTRKRLGY